MNIYHHFCTLALTAKLAKHLNNYHPFSFRQSGDYVRTVRSLLIQEGFTHARAPQSTNIEMMRGSEVMRVSFNGVSTEIVLKETASQIF